MWATCGEMGTSVIESTMRIKIRTIPRGLQPAVPGLISNVNQWLLAKWIWWP